MSKLDNRISTVKVLPSTVGMVCTITMANGFAVTGESVGYGTLAGDIAYSNALIQMERMEAYLAAERAYQASIAPEHLHAREIENYSIADKFNWLIRQPVKALSLFGAMLLADCWCGTEGVPEFIEALPEGRRKCLEELFDSMQHPPTH